MDPFSQELRFREAGVQRDNVYRDIGVSGATGTDQRHGWHRLDGRLSGGDILVVVRIDRIGRRWLDTLQCIIALRARGVRIRSLDETEGWTQFLELEPEDPMAFRRTPDGQHGGVGGGPGAGSGTPAHQGGLGGSKSPGQDPGTSEVPHRRPGAVGPAHEGRRRVGEEDRRAPGGQRKDGSERPEGVTVNICVTTASRTRPGGAETRRNMAKRTSLLGRSRPSERLTREEIAVLDKVTLPPEPPAKPPGKNGGGPQRMVPKDLLTFRWSLECPGCGFKVTGDGQPQTGQRLARCGRCKLVLVLGGG